MGRKKNTYEYAELNRVGMSQNEVAKALGCSRQWVHQVERTALLKLQRAAQGIGPKERVEAVKELRRLMQETEPTIRLRKTRGGVWRQVHDSKANRIAAMWGGSE